MFVFICIIKHSGVPLHALDSKQLVKNIPNAQAGGLHGYGKDARNVAKQVFWKIKLNSWISQYNSRSPQII